MSHQQTPRTLRAAIEAAKNALHRISLASQNSMSSKEECGRIARETIPTLTAALALPDAGAADREALAALQHEQWTGWMRYLFSRCVPTAPGGRLIPQEWVERWQRQMDTPYAELTDAEKDSDRAEADRVIALFKAKPADTPSPSPQPSLTREDYVDLENACRHLSEKFAGTTGEKPWRDLAAKCRTYAEPETGR